MRVRHARALAQRKYDERVLSRDRSANRSMRAICRTSHVASMGAGTSRISNARNRKTWVSELRIAMRMVICKDAELIPFGEMRAPEVLVAAEALAPAALLRAALRAAGPPLVTEPRPHRTPVGMAMSQKR